MQKLKFTKNDPKFRNSSLADFLINPKLMQKYKGCWQDGQGAVAWFSGRQNSSWIRHMGPINTTIDRTALEIAVGRLENMKWFGILGQDTNNFRRRFF